MESLPDAIIQTIISRMIDAKDLAACNCVSKRWKESLPYITSLYFPRNLFDENSNVLNPDSLVLKMISLINHLEKLVVYTPFSSDGLSSWLSQTSHSLKHLELRMDNLFETQISPKSDCIGAATSLHSLKLWGVQLIAPPKWTLFPKLSTLEIVGARSVDSAITEALNACPSLKNLKLLSFEGINCLQISLPLLEKCELDFSGNGYCVLNLNSPIIEVLEVQGCSWLSVQETNLLKTLSISNNAGRVCMIDMRNLQSLETLSMRGVQWSWEAINKMLKLSCNVSNLYMKIEFTGDHTDLLPFPEVDFAEFFNSHPKLRKCDLHGAMFAALCQKNSLKNIEGVFSIPSLEELVVTIRSPLNAEQKISTLESLLKYGRKLRVFTIRILQMKSNHCSADEFFYEVCKLRRTHYRILKIE